MDVEAVDVLPKVGQTVIPGDVIGRVNNNIKIGPGLMQDRNDIVVTKMGQLCHRQPDKYWVDTPQRRYVPAVEEMIVGIVLERQTEGFKVDIGSAFPAQLNYEDGFEVSSRKNRVQWPAGSVIYGRVTLANKDMEPEIACVTPSGKAKGYGKLDGGIVIKCSLDLCRSLLARNCAVLKFLGKKVPYEIAVGLNGRVWIKSQTSRHTILVANTIQLSENLTYDQVEDLVSRMISAAT